MRAGQAIAGYHDVSLATASDSGEALVRRNCLPYLIALKIILTNRATSSPLVPSRPAKFNESEESMFVRKKSLSRGLQLAVACYATCCSLNTVMRKLYFILPKTYRTITFVVV